MRVGILDILALPARHPADIPYHLLITKQFASITPQAIAVWCRRLGHETFYAVYCGVGLDLPENIFHLSAGPLALILGLLNLPLMTKRENATA